MTAGIHQERKIRNDVILVILELKRNSLWQLSSSGRLGFYKCNNVCLARCHISRQHTENWRYCVFYTAYTLA